jgi:hypothetical protein
MSEPITVRVSGPIFDGRAKSAVRSFLTEAKWQVGMDAFSEVHLIMDRSFRNPTPYYETQVTITRQLDDVLIHDRGIIYGPWLEGVGSRNQTTRFKGYAMFRRATAMVQAKVPFIAARVLRKHLSRMQ